MTSPSGAMLLMRATEISGKPVVGILDGDAVADVKDVLYSPEDGRMVGITLNKRGGLFAGPLKVGLSTGQLHAIGPDAVMIESASVLDGSADDEATETADAADRHRNVLGNDVVTDGGAMLGTVTDIVIRAGVLGSGAGSSGPGDVVGYQLKPSEHGRGKDGVHEEFVPLPYTLAVSGTHLVVPASVEPFVTGDLSGFGGAVDAFREQLGAPPRRPAGRRANQ